MAVSICLALCIFYFQQCTSSFQSSSTIMKRLTIAELQLDIVNDEIRNFRADIGEIIDSFKDLNMSCCTQQVSDKVLPAEEVNRAECKVMEFKQRILSAFQAEKQAMFTFQQDIMEKLHDIETQTNNNIKETDVNSINARITATEKMAADIERQVNTSNVSSAKKISDLQFQLSVLSAKYESLQNKLNGGNSLETQVTDCPPQWHLFMDSCYFLSPDKYDWVSARNWCRIIGGYLVEYNSMAEVNFVLGMAKTQTTWSDNDWDGFWVGADDNDEEGKWKTSNKGTKLSEGIQYWLPGQPDFTVFKDEDCMMSLVNKHGMWNDATCSLRLKFACEKKLT